MSIVSNITLAFSNLAGLAPLQLSYKKQIPIYTGFIIAAMTASFAHHLIETNEMGHRLPGVSIPILSKYGKQVRHLDMIVAYSFFGYIVWRKGLKSTYRLVINNNRVLSISLACSFSCDYLISKRPYLYTALHLPWHFGVYYILYKVVDTDTR